MTTATMERVRTVSIRPIVECDIVEVGKEMRLSDAVECLRALGMKPEDAVRFSVDRSSYARVLVVDNKVLVAFGVVMWSRATGRGSPWVLGTDHIYNHERLFVRLSHAIMPLLHSQCPNGMEVMIDADYTTALRWARHLGFDLDGPHEWGVSGAPFMRASIGRFDTCET